MEKELEALKNWENMQSRIASNISTIEYTTIKQALNRLEAIDNLNPSEALECLEEIRDFRYGEDKLLVCQTEMYNTIKQALLKAQEPKQYLKWEDLEFKEKSNTIPVRMGDNVYKMTYLLYENEGFIRLEDCQRIYLELFANEKKFFNDLRLERAEE